MLQFRSSGSFSILSLFVPRVYGNSTPNINYGEARCIASNHIECQLLP